MATPYFMNIWVIHIQYCKSEVSGKVSHLTWDLGFFPMVKPVVIMVLAERPGTSFCYDSITLGFYGPLYIIESKLQRGYHLGSLTCQLIYWQI